MGVDEVLRLVLLFVGVVLAMLCVRLAWQGYRAGKAQRALVLLAVALLLLIPMIRLIHLGREVSRPTVILYAAALVLGVAAARMGLTISSPRKRQRLTEKRVADSAEVVERRAQEDVLRADDRVAQQGERADSRLMFDVGHLDESIATYDHRLEVRDAQDENREHSHGLQDDERDAYRAEQDQAP